MEPGAEGALPALRGYLLNGSSNGPESPEHLSFQILEMGVGGEKLKPTLRSNGHANDAPVSLNDKTI